MFYGFSDHQRNRPLENLDQVQLILPMHPEHGEPRKLPGWKGKPTTEGRKTAFKTACRNAGLPDLHFHGLRHTFVTRKVREGWDYKRIMAITGHKTFAVFRRYNNPTEEDIKTEVVG